jgi:hypothetical protein
MCFSLFIQYLQNFLKNSFHFLEKYPIIVNFWKVYHFQLTFVNNEFFSKCINFKHIFIYNKPLFFNDLMHVSLVNIAEVINTAFCGLSLVE